MQLTHAAGLQPTQHQQPSPRYLCHIISTSNCTYIFPGKYLASAEIKSSRRSTTCALSKPPDQVCLHPSPDQALTLSNNKAQAHSKASGKEPGRPSVPPGTQLTTTNVWRACHQQEYSDANLALRYAAACSNKQNTPAVINAKQTYIVQQQLILMLI
jgi:hypothetical protein